jgi:hypothetical protein
VSEAEAIDYGALAKLGAGVAALVGAVGIIQKLSALLVLDKDREAAAAIAAKVGALEERLREVERAVAVLSTQGDAQRREADRVAEKLDEASALLREVQHSIPGGRNARR